MVFICLLLTLLAAGSSLSACTSQLKSTLISFSILLALLLSGCFLLADHLTDDGINEAVLYHLTMDMSGTGYGDFAKPMALTLAYVLISVGISLAVFRWSLTKKRARTTQYRWIAGIIMIAIAIALNPGTSGLINLAAMMIQTGSPQDRPEQYFAVDPETVSLDGKNLIYLYVESLELNYLNKDLFPGLTPNLQRLRSEATDFTNIGGMWGTSWTIAGMVSSQCGIPLISPGENNSTSGAGQFLPKAICMGDILKSQGYALHYMGGAALTFAGKGLFYRDHGFNHIEGVDSLLAKTPNPDYRNWWGLYDDSLYALLTTRIERLASLEQPFALFSLTLDTHHPKGNVSSSCNNLIYLDGSNPILNAVHCADQLIAKFVSALKNNDLLKNTVLVIASDHLALPNTAATRLKSQPRKNLMLVFDEALPTGEVTKPGTTLDMGPTLINLMGGTLPGLGFGRDLMADMPTLAGTYPNLAKYLRSHRGFLRTLWDFPQIFLGAQLDLEAKTIQLEEQSLKLPIALKLNNSLEVADVMFDFSGRTRLQERIEKLDVHQRFLWVDTCLEIAPLLAANKRTSNSGYCLAYGTLGASQILVHPLEQNFTVAFKEISSYFENIEVTQGQASKRRRRLATYRMTGLMDVEAISTSAPLVEKIIIRSAGGPNHTSSYIKSQSSAELYKVRRGVTLFGVKNDGAIQSLVRVDTCSIAIQDGSQRPPVFREYIDRENKIFDHFVIVSHDSALCRKNKLDLILKGLPLEAWSRLSIREPYIAVIANDKKLAEIKGARDSSLSAVLLHSATRK
jgi:phosphoglycerol transferase